MFDLITILSITGVLFCIYAIRVEKSEKGYVPICERGDGMSCKKVLKSDFAFMAREYFGVRRGSMFDLSNAQYGLIYYTFIYLFWTWPLTLIPYHHILFFIMTLFSIFGCFVLAYILKYVLKTLCLVCVGIYILNIIFFGFAITNLY